MILVLAVIGLQNRRGKVGGSELGSTGDEGSHNLHQNIVVLFAVFAASGKRAHLVLFEKCIQLDGGKGCVGGTGICELLAQNTFSYCLLYDFVCKRSQVCSAYHLLKAVKLRILG